MKGNEKILATLNNLLAGEISAISQYMLHSEMCKNWGYDKLHDTVEKRAIDEMKHAEKLMGRILYLEGSPIVNKINPMHIGAKVEEQFNNDRVLETETVQNYNAAIKEASDLVDNGTRDLLVNILLDEENHVDWLETQLNQITQMGIENYLSLQV